MYNVRYTTTYGILHRTVYYNVQYITKSFCIFTCDLENGCFYFYGQFRELYLDKIMKNSYQEMSQMSGFWTDCTITIEKYDVLANLKIFCLTGHEFETFVKMTFAVFEM